MNVNTFKQLTDGDYEIKNSNQHKDTGETINEKGLTKPHKLCSE